MGGVTSIPNYYCMIIFIRGFGHASFSVLGSAFLSPFDQVKQGDAASNGAFEFDRHDTASVQCPGFN